MTLEPLYDRVIVERVESMEVNRGGIIIPETARGKPQEGMVVAVGPGRSLDNGQKITPAVGVGDRVLFGKYVGVEVTLGERTYLFLRDEDILAKIVTE